MDNLDNLSFDENSESGHINNALDASHIAVKLQRAEAIEYRHEDKLKSAAYCLRTGKPLPVRTHRKRIGSKPAPNVNELLEIEGSGSENDYRGTGVYCARPVYISTVAVENLPERHSLLFNSRIKSDISEMFNDMVGCQRCGKSTTNNLFSTPLFFEELDIYTAKEQQQ
jgi:hypothetical protein